MESREEEEEVSLDANQGILDATSVSEKDKGLSSGVRKEVEAGAERAEEESGG